MRWLLLLVVCLPIGCRSRIQPERESDFFGGVGVVGLPGVGGTLTAGQYFSKKREQSDIAFEMRAAFQGAIDDTPTQDGKFAHIQAGVRQNTSPGHDRRLFFRYGLTWFRANGAPRIIDVPADYFGMYGAVGYEWRLGERVWVGPEIAINIVNGEGSIGSEFLPQVAFNLLFDF